MIYKTSPATCKFVPMLQIQFNAADWMHVCNVSKRGIQGRAQLKMQLKEELINNLFRKREHRMMQSMAER